MPISRDQKLKLIEKLAIQVAQGVVGGVTTDANNPNGDLLHKDGTYSEVKSANDCSGGIIRRKQLKRHSISITRNYVLVFHQNRVWRNGSYVYTTLSEGKTTDRLTVNFLNSLSSVYVISTEGMKVLYQNLCRIRRERTHHFKSGPKTYIKIRQCDFSRLLIHDYSRYSKTEKIKVGARVIHVDVIVITKV